jgi:hypothetical protein
MSFLNEVELPVELRSHPNETPGVTIVKIDKDKCLEKTVRQSILNGCFYVSYKWIDNKVNEL